MKIKKIVTITLIIILSLFILLIGRIAAIGDGHPLKVTWSRLPYEYVIYEDYIEITRYTGNEEDVVIPDKILFWPVREIGTSYQIDYKEVSPFEENEGLKSVYIPDSVTVVGMRCFANCKQLKGVRLSPNLTELSMGIFTGCSSLELQEIPEGIKVIGNAAFAKCASLTKLHLPDSLERIEASAFNYCENLKTIHVPDSVEIIEWDAFGNTKFLANRTEEFVILGDQVLVSYNGDAEYVEAPEGVKYISGHIFEKQEQLKRLVLPESVEKIENILFACPNLEYVVIKNPNLKFPDRVDFMWGCPEAKLVGEKGSTTEAYAKEQGIPFLESIPEE